MAVTEEPLGRYPASGIDVLVVGAGIAGLYFAMECLRNGHKVKILESRSSVDPAGDFLTIGPSATQNLKYWPKFSRDFHEASLAAMVSYYKHTGELIVGPMPFHENFGVGFIRPKLHEVFSNAAAENGIEVQYNAKVVKYFEEGDKAGVQLENGERITADVVAAADGVHSKSYQVVTGQKVVAESSGQAAYRAAFPVEHIKDNALVKKFIVNGNSENDSLAFMAGPGCHLVLTIGRKTASWIFLHKDENDTSVESWANKTTNEEVIETIEKIGGWDESVLEIVRSTPRDHIIDWRLMWRNPQEVWTSPNGRVIQIGDSCHSFLPTSANGATQAMEDGVSLAACLRLAGGKENIPLATQVHNKLRFERISCGQLNGLVRRQNYQTIDWNMLKQQPRKIANPPGDWIAFHNPEEYAINNFWKCAYHMAKGIPFQHTNTPPGYDYKPWNIHQVIKDAAAGKPLITGGNWA